MDTQTLTGNTTTTAPNGIERRMVLRLLTQWREWCGTARFPSFDRIVPRDIPDMWPCTYVLDFKGFENDPVIRVVGEELAGYLPIPVIDCPLSQLPEDCLIQYAVSYYRSVLDKEVPISRGGDFVKYDGLKVLYRSIILPMSDDGETISGLLGAANCREIPDD